MENIVDCLVEAGYFRARISTLSDFDKIIGGMAWAMQVFSYDININIFYTDTLDLGQKIALTERLVMVCLVMNCPHQIEPHQLVGLDYLNILPVLKWLIKRSLEIRQEHEAFNRLLALRHYHRVTNTIQNRDNKNYFVVPINHLKQLKTSTMDNLNLQQNKLEFKKLEETFNLLDKLDKDFKSNKNVSFVKLPSVLKVDNRDLNAHKTQLESTITDDEDDDDYEDINYDKKEKEKELVKGDENNKQESENNNVNSTINEDENDSDKEEANKKLHKELDNELLATNQKILNLLKKLDLMPSKLEIDQYQRRYIELHQQLISKNRDIKKLYALYNSLDSIKHYLTKEINLLDSIMSNLDLTNNSATNRNLFIKQFQDIIIKIQDVRDEVVAKLLIIRKKCDSLNAEYAAILNKQ